MSADFNDNRKLETRNLNSLFLVKESEDEFQECPKEFGSERMLLFHRESDFGGGLANLWEVGLQHKLL